MVAITAILAAVIGAFVFGMGSGVQKTYTVGVTAAQDGDNVTFTFYGGPDASEVTNLNTTVNEEEAEPASTVTVGTTWSSKGGASSGRDHVIVVARFFDGSEQVVLDTYV